MGGGVKWGEKVVWRGERVFVKRPQLSGRAGPRSGRAQTCTDKR